VAPYAERVRRPKISWPTLVALAVAGLLAWWLTSASPLAVAVAVLTGWLILKLGFGILSGLATPLPPPPPPGELRKVRLTYRCSICGTEVRMTSANDEVPDPPRHCQEDMDLVAPIDG
jgi:chromate transport protein ChrA